MDTYKQTADSPLVSVVIPAYNAQVYIERTISSVLAQTYQNLEIIVVDDGSSDRTAEIVKSIAQKDERVILVQQSNSGVAAARNLGIEKSSGQFIAPIDADDIWYPQNIEKQVKCLMDADRSVGLVYSWSVEINEEDCFSGGFHASFHEGKVHLPLLYKFFIGNGSATLMRRECFEKIGGYNCQYLENKKFQGTEDLDFYLRLAEQYQFKVVPEFLIGYRKVDSSLSNKCMTVAQGRDLVLQSIKHKHPDIPKVLYQWSTSNFYVYLAYQSNRCQDYQSSLFWLSKAFHLDWTMTLLRHDLYLLTLQNYLKIFFQALKFSEFNKINQKELKRKKIKEITLCDIYKLVKIRDFLPSKMYEKTRLQRLFKNCICL